MLSHECCRLSSVSYNLATIGGLQGCMVLKHPYDLEDVPHEYSQNSQHVDEVDINYTTSIPTDYHNPLSNFHV
jgi:hypothetical protein